MTKNEVNNSPILYYALAVVLILASIAILPYLPDGWIALTLIPGAFMAGWLFGEPSREKTYKYRGDPSIENLASTESVKELKDQAQNIQDCLEKLDETSNKLSQNSKLLSSERKYFAFQNSSLHDKLVEIQGELKSITFLNNIQKTRLTTKISEILDNSKKGIQSNTKAIESLVGEFSALSEGLRSQSTKINDSLNEIKDLLPRHEAFELAQDYHSARRGIHLGWTYFGFFLVLALYIAAVMLGLHFGNKSASDQATTSDWANEIFGSIAFRVSIHFPFAAAAFILGRQIFRSSRSREEYRHKEGVMKTYRGFSGELRKTAEASKSEDERRLVNLVIDTIARPPAGTFILPKRKRVFYEDLTHVTSPEAPDPDSEPTESPDDEYE